MRFNIKRLFAAYGRCKKPLVFGSGRHSGQSCAANVEVSSAVRLLISRADCMQKLRTAKKQRSPLQRCFRLRVECVCGECRRVLNTRKWRLKIRLLAQHASKAEKMLLSAKTCCGASAGGLIPVFSQCRCLCFAAGHTFLRNPRKTFDLTGSPRTPRIVSRPHNR